MVVQTRKENTFKFPVIQTICYQSSLSWAREDWNPWEIVVFQTVHVPLAWKFHFGLGAVTREVVWRDAFQVRTMKCCPWLGMDYVHVLRFVCNSSKHSHWSIQRFGAHRITSYLCGFLLHSGRSQRWQDTEWLREKNIGLGGPKKTRSASHRWHIPSLKQAI